jgi:Flp pilus assembly protein TadD
MVVLAFATAWGMVASGKPVLPGSSSARMLRNQALDLAKTGSVADAHTLLTEALRLRPMDYMLYHWRGQISLQRLDTSGALHDFSLSRALEPHAANFCGAEGVDWLDVQPEYAVIGWREFMRRHPAAVPGTHGFYRHILNYSQSYPEIRQPVWELAKGNLELQMDYILTVQTREDFERCLRDVLSRQPDLAGIDAVQRMNLFTLWQRLGDPEALVASIAANKVWERDGGWKLLAEHHAKKSEFEAACRLAEVYLPSLHRATPGGTTDVQALERAFLFNPMDPQNGINLFQAYKNRSEYDQAIRTLEKVRNSNNPPNYIDLEIAALHMAKKDFRRAWEHYSKAAAATK